MTKTSPLRCNYGRLRHFVLSLFLPLTFLFAVNTARACDTSPVLTASNVTNIGGGFYTFDLQVCIGVNGSQNGFDVTMGCGLNIVATAQPTQTGAGGVATAGIAGGVLTYSFPGPGWFEPDDGIAGPCFNMTLTVDGDPAGCSVTSTGINDGCLIFTTSWSTTVPAPCGADYTITCPAAQSGNTVGGGNTCALRGSEDNTIQVILPCADTWTFSLCGGSAWDTYLYLGTNCCVGDITFNDDFCGLQSQMTAALAAGTYYVTVEAFSAFSGGAYTLNVTSANPCTPLPVGLLTFSGEYQRDKNSNFLSWITTSEVNNDYFLVERSYDGENFTAVGEVDGVGSSIVENVYSFYDPVDSHKLTYYRLKQVDTDGAYEYSNTITIDNRESSDIVFGAIYPNPANQTFVVKTFAREEMDPVIAEVYSDQGKLVNTEMLPGSTNESNYEIDIENIPSGVYSVHLKTNGYSEVQRLVVIH